MKSARIEIQVTAFVHVADGLQESFLPIGVPFHNEEITITRLCPLTNTNHQSGIVKEHTECILRSIAAVLPDKLAHGARRF